MRLDYHNCIDDLHEVIIGFVVRETEAMAGAGTETYRYQFVAGNLALDFINTVAYRFHPEKLEDHLRSAQDARRWADQAQLPGCDAVNSGPAIAAPGLRRIRVIREDLFVIFHRIAHSKPVPIRALREVDHALAECSAQRCLSVQNSAIRWTWRSTAKCWHRVLYPVLTAAAGLLTSGARDSIRQCADASCGWLFLDRSNAGKRRWCRMADCGNRNKAREYHRRQGGTPEQAEGRSQRKG